MTRRTDDRPMIIPSGSRSPSVRRAVCVPADTPSYLIDRFLSRKTRPADRPPFVRLYRRGETAIVTRFIGAPLAVMNLESLIASGAQEIVFLGFCGSLSPRLPMLSAVSPLQAVSQEGTSRHYFVRRRNFRPHAGLRKRLEDSLRCRGLPFVQGTVVTTDAPFRETASWLAEMKKRGAAAVDMELAAVFALAEYRSVRAAALMIVSDEVHSETWTRAFRRPEFEATVERYFLPFLDQSD